MEIHQRIACFMVTYNEAERLGAFLTHATKWANEIIICDKGSSDQTKAIAEAAGAKVYTIPYTEQGKESTRELIKNFGSQWNLVCTPSDIPTRKLIEEINQIIRSERSSELDAILIPRKTYSFGEDIESGPWGICYIPNAINKDSELIGEKVHVLVDGDAKMQTIGYATDVHILHQTHISPHAFLRSHVEYAIKTCEDDKDKAYRDSIRTLRRLRDTCNLRLRRSPQFHAWRMYHHAICLTAKTIDKTTDIKMMYQQRAREYSTKFWKEGLP